MDSVALRACPRLDLVQQYADLLASFDGFLGMLRVDAEGLVESLLPDYKDENLVCVVCCKPTIHSIDVASLLRDFSSITGASFCDLDVYRPLNESKFLFPVAVSVETSDLNRSVQLLRDVKKDNDVLIKY